MKIKNIYNKIYTILILMVVAIVLESCSSEWLEPKPLSIFTPENSLVDSRGMMAALTASDRLIRDEWFTTGNRTPMNTEMIFSEISVDASTDQGYAPFNLDAVVTPGGSQQLLYINWYWEKGYEGIKYANLIINRIDNATYKDEAEKNAILSMAYFYRSYWYYRLTHQFGDVPFIGEEIMSPRLDFYSTEREVILKKIKKDLEFAVEWASDNVDRGRATKGACAHLLAKVCLALADFDGAIAAASSVIDGGVYKLMTEPFGTIPSEEGNYIRDFLKITRDDVVATLHWHENKANPENKEVLYMVLSREDLVDSRLQITSMYRLGPAWSKIGQLQLYTPDGYGPGTSDKLGEEIDMVQSLGRGQAVIRNTPYHHTWIWNNPKDDSDLRHRRGNWIDMEDLVYNHPATKKSAYYGKHLQLHDDNGQVLTLDTIRNWFGWPHYKIYIPDPRRTPARGGAGDWYVIRLADTYLIRAEAYWWKGDMTNAMADLNKVRTRAHAAPITDASKFNIGTILDERARELYWEEPRKTELTRMAFIFAKTGKPSYNGKTYSLNNFSEDNFWFDRVNEKNGIYNRGVIAINGLEFKISNKHVLWPVPEIAIKANTQGVINQNFGYDGYDKNVSPLTSIPPEQDN